MLIFQKSFLCQIKMNNKFIFVFSLHNLPEGSQFRYDFNDFEGILSAIPNIRYACILCGHLKFPSTNWHTLLSNSEEEIQIIELLDFNIFQKKFSTCSRDTLDVAFCQNIALSAEMDENFSEVSDCSDHLLTKLSVDCSSVILSFKMSVVLCLWTTQWC